MRVVYKLSCILLISIGMISCDRLVNPKTKVLDLDTVVDYSTVDTPPTFSKCKDLIDQDKVDCFQLEMNSFIKTSLEDFSFSQELTGSTINLIIQIDTEGKLSLYEIQSKIQIKDLQKYLENKFQKQPRLVPAIKRGVPVTVQYTIPIGIYQK